MAEWLLLNGAVLPDEFQGRRFAHCVALIGHLEVLKWLAERGQLNQTVGLIASAAEKGHFGVVRWLIAHREESSVNASGRYTLEDAEGSLSIHIAAGNGHLQVAKYLRARQKAKANDTDVQLRFKQNRRVVRVLRGCKLGHVSGKTMASAASEGFLDVVRWLYDEYGVNADVDLFDFGTRSKWQEAVFTIAMDGAAYGGHLDVVRYLHQLQRSLEANPRKRKRGDSTNRFKSIPQCTKAAMNSAASNGHLHVVQWLHSNLTEGCSTDAMDFAARGGHLIVVRWLKENRSEGSTTAAMDAAAANGHLSVVKWLHKNTTVGCTTEAMDGAASNGHLDVVKWLHTHRSEGCAVGAMNDAAASGFLDVVKWLHQHRTDGCTIDAVGNSALEGHLHVLKWFHSHRPEMLIDNVMFRGAQQNPFEILLFLLTECSSNYESQHLDALAVIESGVTEIHEWVMQHYPEVLAEVQ